MALGKSIQILSKHDCLHDKELAHAYVLQFGLRNITKFSVLRMH